MISPPARNFLNSSFVNVDSLRDIEKEPLVEINSLDAAARGIATGDTVFVNNRPIAVVGDRYVQIKTTSKDIFM
jgi:anaerobic selenocysteine-containing dehydrogenase